MARKIKIKLSEKDAGLLKTLLNYSCDWSASGRMGKMADRLHTELEDKGVEDGGNWLPHVHVDTPLTWKKEND